MRQAGRYMPQYQAIRKKYSLLELFHTPDLIVEITKQPIDILGVDAAILFSDILTLLDGLGVEYDFCPGPTVNFQGIQKKRGAYAHIDSSIRRLKRELDVPLIGFSGGPITLLSYMLDDFKKQMICEEELFDQLFDQVLEETIAYLKLQEDAGVDCVQIFDSWARTLSPPFFQKYVVDALSQIVDALNVPVILFCKGAALELVECQPACISVDWTFDLADLRKKTAIPLQGNLDPTILYGSKQTIVEHTQALLRSMRGDPGFIFNLGHGMLPDIPVENVHILVETVKASAALYQLPHSSSVG
ncbi:MAG: Uroporphyrinogen decarboxylase [Chlamydiales bacterium]|nr:Uroporphyrinogen decarboxylase [Chlamydiales bacterium]MCH9635363.1 Uroporphyrinogen decarboxylase [Chlamydiales bacterium]